MRSAGARQTVRDMAGKPTAKGAARRVAIVDFGLRESFGGTKRVLCNVALHLREHGWEPHAIFHAQGPFVELLERAGIPVSIVGGTDRAISSRSDGGGKAPGTERLAGIKRDDAGRRRRAPWRQFLWDLRSHQRYWWRDRQDSFGLTPYLNPRPDVLHFNWDCHPGTPWIPLARREGIPYFTHEHGSWRRPPAAFRTVASNAAGTFCLTGARVAELQEFCRGRARPVLLPNGLDPAAFRPVRARADVRAELGVGVNAVLLLSASHIQPWKGQILIPRAAQSLRASGIAFVWIVCGTALDADYMNALQAEIAAAQLTDVVRVIGPRNDMPDVYAAADIMVHTSVAPEPFGMILIESMVVGTPVVAARDGAVPEIVREGRDGLLYEPGNAADLARAVGTLAAAPRQRAEMGASGRDRVAAEYHINKQVERLAAAYEGALRR